MATSISEYSDFCVRSWTVSNGYNPKSLEKEDYITAWCENEEGKDVCLHFYGFYQTICYKIDNSYKGNIKNSLIDIIKNSISEYNKDIQVEITEGQRFWTYQTDKYSYVVIHIPYESMGRDIRKIFKNGFQINTKNVNMKIVLSEVDVGIDIRHKFVVSKSITYTGWIRCSIVPCNGKAICQEYVADHKTLIKGTKVGFGNPIVLAYDLECFSPTGELPDPNITSNYIGMVSLIYGRDGEVPVKELITIFPPDIDQCDGNIIHVVQSEKELLKRFMSRIEEINPLWIIGHNSDCFDAPYVIIRSGMYGLPLLFSKFKGEVTNPVVLQDMMNGRFRKGMYINGRGYLYKDTQKAVLKFKWRSYSLKNAALELFKEDIDSQKIDLGGVSAIFDSMKYYNPNDPESINKITKICLYCIQDSVVTWRIFFKLNTHVDDCSFANVADVPVDVLNTKGQMIRCKNSIYRQCKTRKNPNGDTLISFFPDVSGISGDSFKGGAVSEPVVGFQELVCTLDFSSLYPSIIIAYNICYTTFIDPINYSAIDDPKSGWGLPYDKDTNPDARYHKIVFDEDGVQFEYRFVTPKMRVGILPNLSKKYISERNLAKKEMIKHHEESYLYQLYDILQLGIKIKNNSTYGFLKSPGIYCFLPAARVVTALGRMSKALVESYFQEQSYDLIYGDTDSVMGKYNSSSITAAESYKKAIELCTYINSKMINGLSLTMEKMGYFYSISAKMYIYWEFNNKTGDFKVNSDGTPNFIVKGVVTEKRDRCMFHINLYKWIYTYVMVNARAGTIANIKTYGRTKLRSVCEEILCYIWQSCIDMFFRSRLTKAHHEPYYEWVKSNDGTLTPVTKNEQLEETCLNVYDYNWKDFDISYKMGKDYKVEGYFLNVLAKRLRSIGRCVNTGDRFGSVYIKESNKSVGSKIRIIDEYEENLRKYKNNSPDAESMTIDHLYYLDNKIADTTDLLVYRGFPEYIHELEDIKARKKLYKFFGILYCKFKQRLLKCIKGKKHPQQAVQYSADIEMREYAKKLYSKMFLKNTEIDYQFSQSIVGNIIKHMKKRQLYIDQIRVHHTYSVTLLSKSLNLENINTNKTENYTSKCEKYSIIIYRKGVSTSLKEEHYIANTSKLLLGYIENEWDNKIIEHSYPRTCSYINDCGIAFYGKGDLCLKRKENNSQFIIRLAIPCNLLIGKLKISVGVGDCVELINYEVDI